MTERKEQNVMEELEGTMWWAYGLAFVVFIVTIVARYW